MLSKVHFLDKYKGFKNIKFPRADYQTDRPKTLSTLFTSKFSSAHQFKNHIELLSTFFDESHRKPNAKSENKTDRQPLFVISIVNVFKPTCSLKIFTDKYYPSGYFPWMDAMGLWCLSVDKHLVASCGQFKLVRIS